MKPTSEALLLRTSGLYPGPQRSTVGDIDANIEADIEDVYNPRSWSFLSKVTLKIKGVLFATVSSP